MDKYYNPVTLQGSFYSFFTKRKDPWETEGTAGYCYLAIAGNKGCTAGADLQGRQT